MDDAGTVAVVDRGLRPAGEDHDLQVAAFGVAFVLLGLCTDTSYALVAGTVGPWLRQHVRLLCGERYVVGSAFVGLGVAAAFSSAERSR